MIVDCHGHYTTAPGELGAWRQAQVAGRTTELRISDDQIRDSLEAAQLKLQRERGSDVTFFSPRAIAMEHHVGDAQVSAAWSRVCNDLIHRCCALYPKNFAAVCQLPQSPGVPPQNCIAELERCVRELGFHRLQPESRPVRRLLEGSAAHRSLVVPALREDGRARRAGDGARERIVQPELPRHRRALHQRRYDRVHAVPHVGPVQGLPTLRFVIPHGGGAVPYHWGRYRGLART
jgi:4-oxalmesaconate hydratase